MRTLCSFLLPCLIGGGSALADGNETPVDPVRVALADPAEPPDAPWRNNNFVGISLNHVFEAQVRLSYERRLHEHLGFMIIAGVGRGSRRGQYPDEWGYHPEIATILWRIGCQVRVYAGVGFDEGAYIGGEALYTSAENAFTNPGPTMGGLIGYKGALTSFGGVTLDTQAGVKQNFRTGNPSPILAVILGTGF